MTLREYRKQRKWTLEEAASRAMISRSGLSYVENGRRYPTDETVRRLARAYEVAERAIREALPPRQLSGRGRRQVWLSPLLAELLKSASEATGTPIGALLERAVVEVCERTMRRVA